MNTDLINALSRRPAKDGCPDFDLEEKLEPVLQEMLAGVGRYRETPLLSGFDSLGIVRAALQSLSASAPKSELHHLQDSETVEAVFNLLVKRALLDEPDPSKDRICLPGREQGNDAPAMAGEQRNEKAPHPLAVWLEHFYTVMREVHPRAIEIVGLRLEGYNNRDVAQRLGLTLRLIKRIVHDMQRAWENAMGKE